MELKVSSPDVWLTTVLLIKGGRGLFHWASGLVGAWVPTRVAEGLPVCRLNERLATYKYVVWANGDWVDELYPSHKWATWHRPSAARVY